MNEQWKMIRKEPAFKGAKEKRDAYRQLFSTREGEKVLQDLLRECSMERNAFNKDHASQTNFNLGKQCVGYHIVNLMYNIEFKPTEKEDNDD